MTGLPRDDISFFQKMVQFFVKNQILVVEGYAGVHRFDGHLSSYSKILLSFFYLKLYLLIHLIVLQKLVGISEGKP